MNRFTNLLLVLFLMERHSSKPQNGLHLVRTRGPFEESNQRSALGKREWLRL